MGFNFAAINGVLKVSQGNRVVLKAERINNLYYLQGSTVTGTPAVFIASNTSNTKLWHMHLGHMSEIGMHLLHKKGYLNDIGYCCSTSSSGNGGVVYRVETYLSFEWPLIGGTFKIPITNDSKPVYKGKCESYDSCNK